MHTFLRASELSNSGDAEVHENYGLTEAGGITAGAAGQLQTIKDGVQVRLEDPWGPNEP